MNFSQRKRNFSKYKHKSNDELLSAIKESKKHEKSKSKNKKRIEIIREELKELGHKLSKSELKEIKKQLYNIENKKGLLE